MHPLINMYAVMYTQLYYIVEYIQVHEIYLRTMFTAYLVQ